MNVRYGYLVSYPADLLVAEPESDAGDGRRFHARQGSAKLVVWAEWRLDDDTIDQTPFAISRSAASDCAEGKVSYRLVRPAVVAMSCVTKIGVVVYQKTLISKDKLTSVRFEYPYAERKRWDQVVTRVAASLHGGSPAQ
ncbi:MAG: hypothetical protein AB1429_03085 [Pseudomonadota bacterium]